MQISICSRQSPFFIVTASMGILSVSNCRLWSETARQLLPDPPYQARISPYQRLGTRPFGV
jgi:hypothetical protein